jgi:arginase family enzyme
MVKRVKIFGAALDATDFPLNVQTKMAYLTRLSQNTIKEPNFLDPHDGFLLNSRVLSDEKYIKIGKFPIESWLTPKPDIEDFPLINQLMFQRVTNDGTIKDYSDKLEIYVKSQILPDIPLMIGPDHSLSGGVLQALSKEYGTVNILIVVFDSHFDGIPASLSIKISEFLQEYEENGNKLLPKLVPAVVDDLNVSDTYTCASYLYYLLQERIILPENLIIFGCQDYPDENFRLIEDPRAKEFVAFFDSLENRGVKFIPKMEESRMIDELKNALDKRSTPYIYISFDVDVGSLKDVIAARFRNAIGIDRSTILSAAKLIKNYMDSRKCDLIGLDVMEVETHLLGREFPKSGRKDLTVEVVDEFLKFFI